MVQILTLRDCEYSDFHFAFEVDFTFLTSDWRIYSDVCHVEDCISRCCSSRRECLAGIAK